MIYTHIGPDDTADRIRLKHALRQLLFKDLELMEGIKGCDYCKVTPEGHGKDCVFMKAVGVVYSEGVVPIEDLKYALGDLLKADNALIGTGEYICPYCDEDYKHAEDCVYHNAITAFLEY